MIVKLILLGPPGAGKGTQAERLAQSMNLAHISTGALLRVAVNHGTDLGRQASAYMDKGELVPDQLILGLVREQLSNLEGVDGWILDGFPRNEDQAKELDILLADLDASGNVQVVNLEVPDQILVKRLLSRGRQDDTEAVVKNRLQVYRNQTAPLIDFYQTRNQLLCVDGTPEVDVVTQNVRSVITT